MLKKKYKKSDHLCKLYDFETNGTIYEIKTKEIKTAYNTWTKKKRLLIPFITLTKLKS